MNRRELLKRTISIAAIAATLRGRALEEPVRKIITRNIEPTLVQKNNFDSDITRKISKAFIEQFEANRIVSRSVDTHLFNSDLETITIKRPKEYRNT